MSEKRTNESQDTTSVGEEKGGKKRTVKDGMVMVNRRKLEQEKDRWVKVLYPEMDKIQKGLPRFAKLYFPGCITAWAPGERLHAPKTSSRELGGGPWCCVRRRKKCQSAFGGVFSTKL